MIFNFFGILAGLINPLIMLLIGYLLTQVEDLLDLINVLPKDKPVLPNKKKTIKLIKLVGMLMVIGGGLSVLSGIIRFFGYIINFLDRMF